MIPPPGSHQYIDQLKILPLTHASSFCQIATKIQDRLVESPLLPFHEIATYDAQILNWHEELPSILSNLDEPCPEFLGRVRLIMKWRFQNIRLVLHRPVLLTTALRRCAWSNLTAEEKIAVGKCRLIAGKTIEDISKECLPDLISGWNAVWLCFQACMVPLVSLFSDASMPEEVEKWKASIETALHFFQRVKDWSIAAKRSSDAVSGLYQAYKAHASTAPSVQPTPAPLSQSLPQVQLNPGSFPIPSMATTQADFAYMEPPSQVPLGYDPAMSTWTDFNANDPMALNHYWDDMMWDTNLPDMLDVPYGVINEYEFGGAAQDSGAGGAYWMHGN